MFFSRRSKIIIAFLISAATVWLVSDFALAQTLNTGINDTNVTSIGLASFDLKVFVVRIIQIVLGFLGLISVVLVIYAGFTWMTSGGNEEKIANAKKTLRNALIGLVIIFSSFGIATYVINRLLNATGVQEEMLVDQKMKAVNTGLGVAGSCTVESLLPEAMQKGLSRNSLIMVMFKEPVDPKTFCSDATCTQLNPSAVRIYKNVDGDSCPEGVCQSPNKNFLDAKVFAADNNRTIIISPNTYLGSSSDNIWYTVHLSNDIKAATGKGIFSTCSINYLEWSFEVSSTIDTVPPKIAGVFPPTDNTQDTVSTTVAKVAKGLIAVASSPKTYTPASVLSVTKVGSIPSATAVMSPDYHDTDTVFKVDVTGNGSKAQLFVVSGTKTLSLGTTDINPGTKDKTFVANFAGYFTLTIDTTSGGTISDGNEWQLIVVPEILADSLTIGSNTYTFSKSLVRPGKEIVVDSNPGKLAQNIVSTLSSNSEIKASVINGNSVEIIAATSGSDGNNINISTTNPSALTITGMTGGANEGSKTIQDKADQPMNTIIQINFNEAINPQQVFGPADSVYNVIKVVNANGGAASGANCSADANCLSYKCDAVTKKCVGNYVNGKFVVASGFKAVEFYSDNICGVNGCGDPIYCLPANAKLAVTVRAASLATCTTDLDCAKYAPFKSCLANVALGYKTCQDKLINGNSYSLVDSAKSDGVMDTAQNSFDGNKDGFSAGPGSLYNENTATGKGDNYTWSFFTNSEVKANPPVLESINPVNDQNSVNPESTVQVKFGSLMASSTLKTGSKVVETDKGSVEHKLINLKSSIEQPLGYWLSAENIDSNNDASFDKTTVDMKHTSLSDSVSYSTQIGSGVNDIYQNCFKPSAGPSCSADKNNPSCCFGVPVGQSGLDSQGNCK